MNKSDQTWRLIKKINLCALCILNFSLFAQSEEIKKEINFENECEIRSMFCFIVGITYDQGLGVTVDKEKAAKYYEKGCNVGESVACNNLGAMFARGDGVSKDVFKAVELYKKSCDDLYQMGCFNLGAMYLNGTGVRYDKNKAIGLFGKACDLKYEKGCEIYARLLKNE
jgi:uncharacterized protein